MLNYRVITHLISFLLMLEGGFMLLGIPFSIFHGDDDIWVLIGCGLSTSLVGIILWYFSKSDEPVELKKREGYVIVTLSWFVFALFGAIPFVVHGSIPSYTDAFFETMSGFTTTGATILKDIEVLPHGLLFWRALTHWLGGMGIIVLSIAILPLLGIGGMQLFQAEVAGPSKDKIHPRVQETAKRLWAIYVLFTSTETLLLMLGGMSLFDALTHSFATLASGGFSTKNQSIAYYNSPFIEYVIIIFMFIAGTNFSLHYMALKGRVFHYFKESEFKFYLYFIIITVTGTALFLALNNGQSIESSFRHSAFSIISILSSTGFATVDYESWAPFFSIIFLILLLFGACAGSTSGGVKMVRYQLLIKNSFMEIKRLLHPQAIIPVRQNDKVVPYEIVAKVGAFVLIYLIVFGFAAALLNILGMDIISALGASAACLGNIGPGLNQTGPVTNYSSVPFLGKWILSFVMLLGRLEIYTIMIIFSKAFWKS